MERTSRPKARMSELEPQKAGIEACFAEIPETLASQAV
jgi:hypothetical protein